MIKYITLILLLSLSFLAGYNSGFNNGWDRALVTDPQCKNSCEYKK